MPESCSIAHCVQPEALVIVKVIPLCLIPPSDVFVLACAIAQQPVSSASYTNLPARFACIMSCPQALAFAEENGYVAF